MKLGKVLDQFVNDKAMATLLALREYFLNYL